MKIRVLLADDHKMFRHGLKLILENDPDIEVVGEADDGTQALALSGNTSPDVVCMDISMPGMDGLEATRRLLSNSPASHVIGLSAHADTYRVMGMMNAGAYGFVTKSEASGEILQAIHEVHHTGKKYLSPAAASHMHAPVQKGESYEPSLARLSARERQVLQLVAEGWSSADIAHDLNLAVSTIEVHRRNIMRKINLHSVAELTRYAIHHGIAGEI